MPELLPVGAEVLVTPQHVEGIEDRRPYKALVHGYDMGHTKYQLRPEVMGWSEKYYHPEAICWAFPSEVEATGGGVG